MDKIVPFFNIETFYTDRYYDVNDICIFYLMSDLSFSVYYNDLLLINSKMSGSCIKIILDCGFIYSYD